MFLFFLLVQRMYFIPHSLYVYRVPEFCYSTPVAGGKGSEKGTTPAPTLSGPSNPLTLRLRVAGYQKDFNVGEGGEPFDDLKTVSELKAVLSKMISGEEGKKAGGPSEGKELPVNRMRLIFAGRPMNNDKQVRPPKHVAIQAYACTYSSE